MQFYESEPLLNAEGVPVARFAIFSETPRNPKPQYNVQLAVNQYVGNHEYYDFVEEWLDNPWIRVVLFGLEHLQPQFGPFYGVQRLDYVLHEDDAYNDVRLIILWETTGMENPNPIIENALNNAVAGASYNAFVLSSLNYPWIRVVIKGINNFPFIPYDNRVVNV